MSALTTDSVPRLPRGVRLRFDDVRKAHVLLAPERAFDLDDTAAAVLELVDGQRRIGEIVAILADRYAATSAEIEGDVQAMLADLVTKRVLDC